MLVTDAEGQRTPRLAWRTQVPMNPASVTKLVSTVAALDLLGPAYTWRTPVYLGGTVHDGVLEGNLYLQGRGDPALVTERLWLLLRRVQALGVRSIHGDIVLDRSAFDPVTTHPAAFDGKPLEPYNAQPDALLVNFKSAVLTFTPAPDGRSAQVGMEPPLAGVVLQPSVPLAPNGNCDGWRGKLRAQFRSARISFAGSYPAGCPEGIWPVAYPDPRGFAARAISGLWAQMGGQLQGQVRDGPVPAGLTPAFEFASPSLAEVIHDMNKFSNNVMAEQLFLTLGLERGHRGNAETARTVLHDWWASRIDNTGSTPVLDNGSGLSLNTRISAMQLGRLLQTAWRGQTMPELAASLPLAGVDGTMRKHPAPTGAHLKTGSLLDSGVTALAGYVDGLSGHRYVLVAIVNHPQAAAARPVFDALVDWVAQDQ